MHPCRQYDSLPDRNLLRYTSKISYYQHIDIISRQRLAKDSFPYFIFILKSACFWYKSTDVRIGIRVAVTEVDSIIVVFSSIFECQAVVNGAIPIICRLHGGGRSIVDGIRIKVLSSPKLSGVLVLKSFLDAASLVICNILAVSLPTDVGGVCILQGIGERPHSFVVSWIGLHEVNHMETVSLIFPCVLNSKVIPLAKTLGAIIIFDVHLIFEWSYFHDFSKITTLKPWLKDEGLIYWERLLDNVFWWLTLQLLFNIFIIDSVIWPQLFVISV